MEISLRNVTDADLEFLWRLHNAALQKYVTETWGWDEEWQRRNFEERFDSNNGRIVVVESCQIVRVRRDVCH